MDQPPLHPTTHHRRGKQHDRAHYRRAGRHRRRRLRGRHFGARRERVWDAIESECTPPHERKKTMKALEKDIEQANEACALIRADITEDRAEEPK